MDWSPLFVAVYFLVLGFLVWLIWPMFIGAIYLPTPMDVVEKMLDIADVGEGDIVYDLGSGDGRIVLEAARRGARAVGIEVDPLRVIWARLRVRRSSDGDRVKVIHGDFFKTNITDATVVTVYQGESINNKLRDKFEDELSTSTRIVSFDFKFDGWEPEKKYSNVKVYLYRVPAKT